jgi:hypothetical protein
LTVDGGSVPIPGGLMVLDNPTQVIKFVAQCSEASGMSTQRFEGTLTPNMPSETPMATKPSRTVTVTHVERTLVVRAPARCPHCGAELPNQRPNEIKQLPAPGEEKAGEQDASGGVK